MGDNNGWEPAAPKDKKAAKAAKAAEEATRDAEKAAAKAAAAAKQVERDAAAAREAAKKAVEEQRKINEQMAKNKKIVESAHPPGILPYKLNHARELLKLRHKKHGKSEPKIANIYRYLANEEEKRAATREAANARAHRELRKSMYAAYPGMYDNIGTAAQGGPGPRVPSSPRRDPSPPRAAPPPNKNAWKYKQSTNWTPAVPAIYPILGIPVTSTKREITKQFRKLALNSNYKHPNHGGETAKFQELQAEYEHALGAAIGGKRKTRRQRKSKRKTRRRA
jgi:hypothetical protein